QGVSQGDDRGDQALLPDAVPLEAPARRGSGAGGARARLVPGGPLLRRVRAHEQARRHTVSDATLPVGVVGVGHLGRHPPRLYAARPGVKLVGVADRDRDRARAIAAEFGCEAFEDAASLAGKIAAGSVATPTGAHREAAESLLAAGADVLVEKPIAATLADA